MKNIWITLLFITENGFNLSQIDNILDCRSCSYNNLTELEFNFMFFKVLYEQNKKLNSPTY
jgi:hypothetical protein